MRLPPEIKRFSTNKTLNVGGRLLDLSRPRLMGILNVTPDSFYDGGLYNNETAVLNRVEQLLKEGADLIDIGGYSSRPGAPDVSEAEELERVLGPVSAIREKFPEAILAIDTFRSNVARAALDAGASIVNDISAGSLDQDLPPLVAQRRVPYIIMHMRGTPQTMNTLATYDSLLTELVVYFQDKINRFDALGITDLIIDPGFGFAKTIDHNYEILSHLEYLSVLGRPILAGLSRKSMIWKTLGITAAEAVNGTTCLNTLALLKGASILRVHDAAEARQVLALMDRIHSFS